MNNSIQTVNPRREELKRLSAQLKPTAQEAQTTLNAAIVFYYGEQTNKPANDFQTLENWNNKGYKIRS